MYAGREAEVGTAHEVVLRDASPVHARPAGVDAPARRRRRRAAAPDPRRAAVAAQPAVGLRVPPALRLRPGALLRRGAAAAPRHRRGALLGVPLRRGARRRRRRRVPRGGRRRDADETSKRASSDGRRRRSTAIPTDVVDGRAPLMSVRELVKDFSVRGGLLSREVAKVQAVSDVSFDVYPRRDARARRRVGMRQVDDRPAGAAADPRGRRGTSCSRAPTSARSRATP